MADGASPAPVSVAAAAADDDRVGSLVLSLVAAALGDGVFSFDAISSSLIDFVSLILDDVLSSNV